MAEDAFSRAFGISDDEAKTTPPATIPTVIVKPPPSTGGDAFDRAFGFSPVTTTPAATRDFMTPEQSAMISTGVAGLARGARDVIDPAAQFLARQFGQGEPVAAGNANDLAAYENQYGDNTLASVGRMGGQGLALIPTMAAVNPLVGGAGRLLAAGVGKVAPMVGNALSAAGDFIGGAAGGPGQRLLQAGSRSAQGAVLGGEAGGLTSGQSDAPIGQQVASGATAGAVLGPAIPGAMDAAGAAYRGLTGASAGAAIPQAAAELVQLARDHYGVMLKAPQIGLNPALRYAANALKLVPGSGAGAEAGEAQGQFNRAVSRTFGEDASRITPDVLSSAQKRIGGVLNGVEKNNNVSFDNKFMDDLASIEAGARSSMTDSDYNIVQRQIDGIMKNVQSDGTITGTTYGNLIHKGSDLDRALRNNSTNVQGVAGEIKEALRDSLTRSLSPEDAAAYQQARTQYKNLKTVEPLTLRSDTVGGPAPSIGDISPQALRAAVNRSYGPDIAQAPPRAVPLNDLARIGQFIKEPGTSGTAERASMLAAGAKAAQLAGYATMGVTNGIAPAAGALAAGMIGGRAASAYLRSDFLARRMLSAALRPPAAGNSLGTQIQPYVGPAGNILSPFSQGTGGPSSP